MGAVGMGARGVLLLRKIPEIFRGIFGGRYLRNFAITLRNGFVLSPIMVLINSQREAERERILKSEKFNDPKRLEPFGHKVYSQNDEDGIIHEIFERIGTTNKKFVEFGVGNGLENNTHFLLFQGWSGLWIDASSQECERISKTFESPIKQGRLHVLNAFIYKDNINDLIGTYVTGDIDFLSVDIDGNDYHVLDAITVISPRVLAVEYNAKFPPYIDWKMEYNPDHVYDGSDKHGASLKAFENLCRSKGYRLVGTNISGVNAFFVKDELAKNLFSEPATADNLYNPMRDSLLVVKSGHPARHYLGE